MRFLSAIITFNYMQNIRYNIKSTPIASQKLRLSKNETALILRLV